jgi:hypothetical protein
MKSWGSLAILAGLLATGCYSTPNKKVKRPELVEHYQLPPQDDLRFSRPPTLPTKVLLDDPLARRRDENVGKDLQGPMTAPGRMGGPPGAMP